MDMVCPCVGRTRRDVVDEQSTNSQAHRIRLYEQVIELHKQD